MGTSRKRPNTNFSSCVIEDEKDVSASDEPWKRANTNLSCWVFGDEDKASANDEPRDELIHSAKGRVAISFPTKRVRQISISWSRARGERRAIRIGMRLLEEFRKGTPKADVYELKEDILKQNEQPLQQIRSRRSGLDIASMKATQVLSEIDASGRRIVDGDVLSVMRLWNFLKNKRRVNVLPSGQDFVASEMLGIVKTRMYNACNVAAATRNHPAVTMLLSRYLQDNLPAGLEPGECFPFTTICINKGYAAKRHRDNNNVGISVVKAFGDFQGGELLYWPRDPGPRNCPDLSAFEETDAEKLDVHKSFQLVDARNAHEVLPFQGERYSLVYFTVTSRELFPKKDRKSLREFCGVEFPADGVCEALGMRLNGRP